MAADTGTERQPWLRRQWLADLRAIWGYEVMDKGRTKLLLVVAWRVPRWLVYWCGVRLFAHGTTGRYGETLAPTLTVVDALERWSNDGR